MQKNNSGYLLMEAVVCAFLTFIVFGSAIHIFSYANNNWKNGEDYYDMSQNYRQANIKLIDEIRESCGLEILDSSNSGWIKIYKSIDKSQFITLKLKYNKLFIGYNNLLNPNAELCNYIETFRVEYLPKGSKSTDKATGVNVYMKFKKDNKEFSSKNCIAFRY